MSKYTRRKERENKKPVSIIPLHLQKLLCGLFFQPVGNLLTKEVEVKKPNSRIEVALSSCGNNLTRQMVNNGPPQMKAYADQNMKQNPGYQDCHI